MGYFSNGTEGEIYRDKYCSKCVHDLNNDCAVLLAHLLYNYDDCNNDKSILHLLIQRTESGLGNKQCEMFIEAMPPNAVLSGWPGKDETEVKK